MPTVKASNVELNVFEPAIPMAEVHEELDEAKLLSEINKHMIILVDPYGRTTGVRPSSVEALALSVMKIVYEYNVPTGDIFKGNEPANMSEMGNLMGLEQVVSRISTATTVEASSMEANVVEPNVPMAADGTTNEVDADAISMPTTPESGRTTTRIEGLKGHRVHLPKSET